MILFRVFSLFKDKLIGAPQLFVQFSAEKNREKKKEGKKYKKKQRGKKMLPEGAYSLMFNLEVQMPSKPVIEQRLLDIARGLELEEGRGKRSQHGLGTAASLACLKSTGDFPTLIS